MPIPPPHRAVADQRILIEEMLEILPYRRQNVIVQGQFKAIVVFGIRLQTVHFAVPESQRHSGAGLQVGIVRQHIVLGKALDIVPGADAAADMQLAVHHAVPEGVQRRLIVRALLLLRYRR